MDRNKSAFQEFLELCRVATNSDTVVLDLVQQRYSRTDSHFLGSRDFQQLINTCSGKINADPSNKFVYIRDFVNHLKVHKTKPKKLPPCHQDCSSSPDDVPEPKRYKPGIAAGGSDEHSSTPSSQHKSQNVAHSCENSNKSLQSPERLQNVEIVQEALPAEYASKSQLDVDQLSQHCIKEIGDSNQDGPKEKQQEESSVPKEPASSTNATERHIKRLEKLLAAIDEQIRKLQEKELTLDEMEDEESSYLLEDKYKRKFVKVWNKLCELKGMANTTGRATEKSIRFEGTQYKEVNLRISHFVNKYKVFPDFQDVLEIIHRCNDKFNLGLAKTAAASLSREAFAALGNLLQERRIQDYESDMGCRMTDSMSRDPALTDPSLRQKLSDSRKEGLKRLEQVIDKYADRQDNYESEDEEENVAADETEKKLQLPSMSNGECGGSLTAGRSTNDGHKPSLTGDAACDEVIVLDDDDDAEVENRHVVPAVEAVLVCDSDDDCPGDQLCNTPVHADAVHCQATRVS